jgi:hypothetical protein
MVAIRRSGGRLTKEAVADRVGKDPSTIYRILQRHPARPLSWAEACAIVEARAEAGI